MQGWEWHGMGYLRDFCMQSSMLVILRRSQGERIMGCSAGFHTGRLEVTQQQHATSGGVFMESTLWSPNAE